MGPAPGPRGLSPIEEVDSVFEHSTISGPNSIGASRTCTPFYERESSVSIGSYTWQQDTPILQRNIFSARPSNEMFGHHPDLSVLQNKSYSGERVCQAMYNDTDQWRSSVDILNGRKTIHNPHSGLPGRSLPQRPVSLSREGGLQDNYRASSYPDIFRNTSRTNSTLQKQSCRTRKDIRGSNDDLCQPHLQTINVQPSPEHMVEEEDLTCEGAQYGVKCDIKSPQKHRKRPSTSSSQPATTVTVTKNGKTSTKVKLTGTVTFDCEVDISHGESDESDDLPAVE